MNGYDEMNNDVMTNLEACLRLSTRKKGVL